MEDDKRSLKVFLGILALLAVMGALWRVLSYQPVEKTPKRDFTVSTVGTPSRAAKDTPGVNDTIEELLGESPSPAYPAPYAKPQTGNSPMAVQPLAYPQNRASAKQAYHTSSPAGKRYVDNNFYDTDKKIPTQQPREASSSAQGYSVPSAKFDTSSADRMREERSKILAPYLRPNGQDKARMDAQWNKLAAALERAVAKALTPRSKKEEMIEKYAAKPSGTQPSSIPGFAGALAPVGEQLAMQKQQIVQSMGNAFGGAAAQQAGGIMDSFAGELAAALNAPDSTPAQKEQQVKEITQKYQQKMDKLAEKNQYDKFVADRVTQDNRKKEELGALYPEQRDQIGQLIDQTREKDLALATQNLPREEYFNQLAQNNKQLHDGIQELVTQGGKSVQDFRQWEQEQDKKYLETLAKLEEEGQIQSVARVAGVDERKQTQADIKVNSELLDGIVKTFGEEAKADFEPIFKNLEQSLNQIDNEKLSIVKRENKKNAAIKEANRQLVDQKIHYVQKMDIPEAQKQQILEELHQAYDTFK